MPVTYSCDVCGQSGPLAAGWVIVNASASEVDEEGVRQGIGPHDFYFHTRACYDAWIAPTTAPPA